MMAFYTFSQNNRKKLRHQPTLGLVYMLLKEISTPTSLRLGFSLPILLLDYILAELVCIKRFTKKAFLLIAPPWLKFMSGRFS